MCQAPHANPGLPGSGGALRISEAGGAPPVPIAFGMRNPLGWCAGPDGEIFFTDNQGDWVAANKLCHVTEGKYFGWPNRAQPQHITKPAGKPTVWVPYGWARSINGVAYDHTGGKFGPFAGQMFVGDQTNSTVMRCFLEQVDGHYQGACFPFREGFGSGSLALLMTSAPPFQGGERGGSLFVGGTNRGWGSRGPKPFALERLDWSGQTPFEIQEMRAKPDGFQLRFTVPVNRETASDVGSYKLTTYTYIFQAPYGSPEVDFTTPTIQSATVSDDAKTVRLVIDGLQEGHIHELVSAGLKSAEGLRLLHKEAYYTLNELVK